MCVGRPKERRLDMSSEFCIMYTTYSILRQDNMLLYGQIPSRELFKYFLFFFIFSKMIKTLRAIWHEGCIFFFNWYMYRESRIMQNLFLQLLPNSILISQRAQGLEIAVIVNHFYAKYRVLVEWLYGGMLKASQ